MKRMEKKYKQRVLPSDKYEIVDKETGEIEDLKTGYMIERIPNYQVGFKSKSFLSFDTDSLKVLQSNGITETDMGLIMLISGNLSFNHNICMNNDKVPHTTLTISQMIKQSKQATKRKLNRLVELNILAYEKIPGNEHFGKVYMVNPYLLRRGKDFSEYLTKIFYDFVQTT